MKERHSGGWAALVLVTMVPSLVAQYSSGFDSLIASSGGTTLTGQDLYYLPPGTASIDYDVYTYAGNSLGIAPHPTGGGANFVAGVGPAAATFARAQRNLSYGSGMQVWIARVDINVTFGGMLPTAQNIGSFSLQPSGTSRTFIALARWTDVNTAATWNADYVYYDAAGTQVIASVPNSGFQGLTVNHWYRWETEWDFNTNRILGVRIVDLSTGSSVSHSPANWYLEGGANPALSLPMSFRFFAGSGTVAGNTVAFDNISISTRPRFDVSYSLGPMTTSVTLDVQDAAGAGVAPVFASSMTGPPFFLPFSPEVVWLNPVLAFPLTVLPLSPGGSGSATFPYPTSLGTYELILQPLVVTPALDLGNAVGASQTFGTSSYLKYNFRSGGWEAGVNGHPAGSAVDVERVDTTGGVTNLGSTTANASGNASLSGDTSPRLSSGERLRLLVGGVQKAKVDA